jgi:ABC-type uncharacterized transport system fused permease/ATPase subunit
MSAAAKAKNHLGSRLNLVVRAFLLSNVRWKAILLFVALLALMVSLNALNVLNSYVGREKLPAIHDEVMRQCDMLDDVKDGILENPRACKFDPTPLTCKNASSTASSMP